MNKFFKGFALTFLVFALVACSSGSNDKGGKSEYGAKTLFLITDVGTINDKSFNQGSWEGLVQLADELGTKAEYIQPQEKSTAAYISSINEAVAAGAKIVVTPGYLFENAVHTAQEAHPNVKFILVDGEPRPESKEFKPAEYKTNTVGLLFREEQSGFLAGYAAVKEGFTKLGFMGGMEVPAVIRFGYGYVAGADLAAKELGVQIQMRYTYLNSFQPEAEHKTKAQAWYNDGVEAIFVAAGGAGNSVMAAATDADKWVIGVDVDQKAESPRVLTSATKNLKASVYKEAKAIVENKFEGGKTFILNIDENMVQLPDDFSRFKKFTKADYEKLYADVKADKDGMKKAIPNTESGKSVTDLKVTNTTVTLVK